MQVVVEEAINRLSRVDDAHSLKNASPVFAPEDVLVSKTAVLVRSRKEQALKGNETTGSLSCPQEKVDDAVSPKMLRGTPFRNGLIKLS